MDQQPGVDEIGRLGHGVDLSQRLGIPDPLGGLPISNGLRLRGVDLERTFLRSSPVFPGPGLGRDDVDLLV